MTQIYIEFDQNAVFNSISRAFRELEKAEELCTAVVGDLCAANYKALGRKIGRLQRKIERAEHFVDTIRPKEEKTCKRTATHATRRAATSSRAALSTRRASAQ
jgi:hypothetical protein